MDTNHYMDFLTTAANNFKYSFQEQLLIFAQKPDATACAEVSWWNICTGEDLSAYQSNAEAAVQALVEKRHELRNELKCVKRRNGVDDAVKAQIKELTAEIRAKRKEVVLCSEIAERSEQVREKLERLNEQKKLERKERDEHELFGRRGRTGRENVAGRG